jgi:hypothetical protein
MVKCPGCGIAMRMYSVWDTRDEDYLDLWWCKSCERDYAEVDTGGLVQMNVEERLRQE